VSIFGISWKGGRRTFLTALSIASVSLVFAGVSWGGGVAYNPATDGYSMYNVTSQMGARAWWDAGYTGQGVDVAVIDTGVSPVQGLNNPGQVVYGPDLSLESQASNLANLDTNGHGTFMAGLIAGHDAGVTAPYSSAAASAYMGVAPDARIVSLKVGAADGGVDVTQVIAAIAWVVQHAQDPGFNIRVINLSYGTNSLQPYQKDPLAFAVEQAWKAGIVVVAAAGNTGYQKGHDAPGLSDPAYDPAVIAVGGYNTAGTDRLSDDRMGTYSASSAGCGSCKNPDFVAPGTHLQGLRDPGSLIDQNHSEGQLDDRYFRGSGTSEAAAITTGVVALIFQRFPNATPDQVKNYIASNGVKVPSADTQAQGDGEIDLGKLLTIRKPANSTQNYKASQGNGSLELSRGTDHISQNGVPLTGEQDIFGNAFNAIAMAQAQATGSSWSGGLWNGSSWSGSSWSGSSWSGSSWSGSSWSGSSWSGSSWSGNRWSGSSWSGVSWSGNSWSGTSWSGAVWAGGSWD